MEFDKVQIYGLDLETFKKSSGFCASRGFHRKLTTKKKITQTNVFVSGWILTVVQKYNDLPEESMQRTAPICMHVCVNVVNAAYPNTTLPAKLWPQAAWHAAFPLHSARKGSLLFIMRWLLFLGKQRHPQRQIVLQKPSSHLNTSVHVLENWPSSSP